MQKNTKFNNALFGMFFLVFLPGCTTYYCTTASMNKQLAKIDTNSIHEVYDFRLGAIGVISGRRT